MSIQGPGSNPARIPLQLPGIPAAPTTPRTQRASQPAAAVAAAQPATLWQMLTPEERTFFQQLATMGQLTYTPGDRPDDRNAAAPTGQRIDVRG